MGVVVWFYDVGDVVFYLMGWFVDVECMKWMMVVVRVIVWLCVVNEIVVVVIEGVG